MCYGIGSSIFWIDHVAHDSGMDYLKFDLRRWGDLWAVVISSTVLTVKAPWQTLGHNQ